MGRPQRHSQPQRLQQVEWGGSRTIKNATKLKKPFLSMKSTTRFDHVSDSKGFVGGRPFLGRIKTGARRQSRAGVERPLEGPEEATRGFKRVVTPLHGGTKGSRLLNTGFEGRDSCQPPPLKQVQEGKVERESNDPEKNLKKRLGTLLSEALLHPWLAFIPR